ncbi:MAG TPA: hypothetical protein VHY34_05355 [Caulobacteraceae bacterium]|nr:hypothetical protein [Caulobacteraceae bacterium]
MTPLRCADFLATIGVNTHVSYHDSQYDDPTAVIAALKHVGLKYVRDVAINSRAPNAGHYGALAAAGVSFCMFWGVRRTMADAIEQIGALEAAYPGAVHALEGPNEIKPSFAYAGATGNDAARKFMADMRAAAGADARLRRKPLVSFTSYTPVATDCDFANDHPYPKAGRQPGEPLRATQQRYVGPGGVMPGKPMVFTEFGYHTLVGKPTRSGAWQGVDLERQAVLIINALFDCAAAGIARTYIYQLMDGYADAGRAPNQEAHFGLFRFDGSPKPAATALKTLFALLADDGPRARDFTPSRLAMRVTVQAPVSRLALRDSSGRNYLALWNESQIWNKDMIAPQEVAPVTASVTLERPAAMSLFDIIDSRRDQRLGTVASANVEVGAHPILLRIG